ncbi:hypothetical protein PF002_g1658 [Phytophthora fragariae]|uniref:Acyltransferase 3 domain-containing protein n=1 Tax=Phytophthora fragariae TaxID=53985 RepID=A0A6A3FUJ4_9STRA|nr:hypothetical protein PF009_g1475 [Phytophthora fragariae]KAE9256759.1 hypothetical protein PF002_g1658 [Phytophthora fragariae]
MKLLAQQASLRSWAIALVDYFQKRFFRVYPLFAVTATVLSCMSFENQHRYFRLKKPEDFELSKVLAFYTGFRPHVFWTLPLEIGYYFIIPAFVLVTLRLRRYWLVGAVPLAVWIVYEGFYVYRNSHMPLTPHLHTFMAGSLGAVVFVKLDIHGGVVGSCRFRQVGLVDQEDGVQLPLVAHSASPRIGGFGNRFDAERVIPRFVFRLGAQRPRARGTGHRLC